MWVYTRFQFIPKMSLIYVYFVTNGQLVTVSVNFPINKYGNKEILIGG